MEPLAAVSDDELELGPAQASLAQLAQKRFPLSCGLGGRQTKVKEAALLTRR
jgi:hypothetical protein